MLLKLKKNNSYYLEHLNNIEEYKKNKKYHIIDNKNIFKWDKELKPQIYSHLSY